MGEKEKLSATAVGLHSLRSRDNTRRARPDFFWVTDVRLSALDCASGPAAGDIDS